MQCPNCGSENVNVEMLQTSMKNKVQGVGLGGHINNAARGLTAVSTFGLSNLVWKKSKGVEKGKFKHTKTCICQECGSSWAIK